MRWTPFKMIPKKFLGIDIGTSSIKIVELSRWGERIKLENYGEISVLTLYEKPFRTFEKSTLLLSSQDISKAILAILKKAKISEKKVIFSIPDFSSFFTHFELPPMTREELPQAVRYEARQHIPLPLSEVTLDWQILEGEVSDQKKTRLKILLVAVPNEVINQYQEIALFSNLELQALEAEVFGLSRSLIGEDKRAIALIDIGAQSTTVSIIDNKVLKRSYSLDTAGNELTQIISKSSDVDYKTAENLKQKYGLNFSLPPEEMSEGGGKEKLLKEILLPLIDSILTETKRISQSFYQTEGKETEKVIIAGGSALLPGLKEYFVENLKIEVEIANPFSNIFYPPILEQSLRKMGPSYAIAVGMALRGFK